jgi:hypothetical protein
MRVLFLVCIVIQIIHVVNATFDCDNTIERIYFGEEDITKDVTNNAIDDEKCLKHIYQFASEHLDWVVNFCENTKVHVNRCNKISKALLKLDKKK